MGFLVWLRKVGMNRRETERNHFSLDSCKSVSDETSMDRFMADQFFSSDHLEHHLSDHRKSGSFHRFEHLTFVQANSSTIFTTLPLSGDFSGNFEIISSSSIIICDLI